LWGIIMFALGLRKRFPSWGTVYDSVTKQPIDPAYVTVHDSTGKQIAEAISDVDGRYGFLLSAGTYTMKVFKTNYVFPSTKLSGRTNDELYKDLYFGETITITAQDQVIEKNIPLDAIGFDWNEYSKSKINRMSFHRHNEKGIRMFSNVIYVAGFLLSLMAMYFNPSLLNIAMVTIYVTLSVFLFVRVNKRTYGSIIDKNTNQPIPFCLLRVLSSDGKTEVRHSVSDAYGRYYCLVPKGSWFVNIEKKNPDGSYTKVIDMQPVSGDKGIIKSTWRI